MLCSSFTGSNPLPNGICSQHRSRRVGQAANGVTSRARARAWSIWKHPSTGIQQQPGLYCQFHGRNTLMRLLWRCVLGLFELRFEASIRFLTTTPLLMDIAFKSVMNIQQYDEDDAARYPVCGGLLGSLLTRFSISTPN